MSDEPRYLQVRNWDRYQNADVFKKSGGRPPWIKLYVQILDDPDMEALTDREIGQLIRVWLLAARTGNKLLNDSQWIRSRAALDSKFVRTRFVQLGFLEAYDGHTVPHNDTITPANHANPSRKIRDDSLERFATDSRLEGEGEEENPIPLIDVLESGTPNTGSEAWQLVEKRWGGDRTVELDQRTRNTLQACSIDYNRYRLRTPEDTPKMRKAFLAKWPKMAGAGDGADAQARARAAS